MRKKREPLPPTQVWSSSWQRHCKIVQRRRILTNPPLIARSADVMDITLPTAVHKGNAFKATATGAVSEDTVKQTAERRVLVPQATTIKLRYKTSTWKTWSRKSLRWLSPTSWSNRRMDLTSASATPVANPATSQPSVANVATIQMP